MCKQFMMILVGILGGRCFCSLVSGTVFVLGFGTVNLSPPPRTRGNYTSVIGGLGFQALGQSLGPKF